MKKLLLLFFLAACSANSEPVAPQRINPATGNPVDPTKTPVKDNLGTPTTQTVNPATGNPVDPTKTPVKDNLGKPATQTVNPATGNPVDPTKTPVKDNLGTPATQTVNPATGNPVDPTKTPAYDNLGRPAPQPVSPATGNPVNPTKPPVKDNPGRPATQTVEETGIVGEVGSGEFTVELDEARAPRRFSSNTSTIYLDETGGSVSAETIRAGVPVTVQYFNEGQRRIATKVTVRKDKPVRPEKLEPKRDENRAKEDAGRLLKKEEELRSKKLEK